MVEIKCERDDVSVLFYVFFYYFSFIKKRIAIKKIGRLWFIHATGEAFYFRKISKARTIKYFLALGFFAVGHFTVGQFAV